MTKVKGKEGGTAGPLSGRRRKRCVGVKVKIGDEIMLEGHWHVVINNDNPEKFTAVTPIRTKRGSKEFGYLLNNDRVYDIIRKETNV